MRKLYTLILSFLLLSSLAIGQQVPRGMKYQAVARDRAGEVLANKRVTLTISLFSGAKPSNVFYSELHELTTNQFGLFDLIIGEGRAEKGEFNTVPWSQEEIWMQISMKDMQKGSFITISSSKLLAVPYAFHAATASELVSNRNYNSNGLTQYGISTIPSASSPTTTTSTTGTSAPGGAWLLGGNLKTNPPSDYLGTADFQYFLIKTNNNERLRVNADGNIAIKRTLSIGANLHVDSSVFLNNALPYAGAPYGPSTLNKGPFQVGTLDRRSPTLLAGTLTVDQATDLNSSLNVDGATDLNGRLNVNNTSPTKLTGTLNVDGVTDLNNNLNVNNLKPTLLTGTLQVNKDATFKERVTLDNAAHQSTSTTTGALVVAGGLGLGRNLNVGGDANFGGHTTFAGAVAITDVTPSTSTTTGALTVGGGVGIGKQLNVGGATQLNNTLAVTGATTLGNTLGVTGATTLGNTLGVTGAATLNNTLAVTGATTLSSTLGVSGITSITNNTQSTSTTEGALVVTGGAGVGQNLNVGGAFTATGATTLNGTLSANGQVTINANVSGGQSSYENGYPLKVQGSGQGIAVKITGSRNNANNFMSFWDDNGMQGRIEGQTLSEMRDDDDYKSELASRAYDVTSAGIDLIFATSDLASAITDQIASAASANACAGLGVVACPPIASLIAGSAAKLAVAIAQEVVVVTDVVFASVNLAQFIQRQEAQVGISYQSSAGDYAEYLMREQAGERIFPGDIVGVRGGKISKKTEGAEKMMVVSHKPIVLGNVPQQGTEANYEKVAFMGQVPVKVFGKVNLGDYIIANGAGNGVGVAVAPDKIEAKDIRNIVGIAWSTASQGFQFNMVNVAVGLNVNDNQKLIDAQQKQINDLKNEMASINSQLEKLIPGFKSASSGMATTTQPATSDPLTSFSAQSQKMLQQHHSLPATTMQGNPNITYTEMTKEELASAFELAEKTLRANGVEVDKSVFWSKFKNDPSYKEFTLNKAMAKYKEALNRQKQIDATMMKQP